MSYSFSVQAPSKTDAILMAEEKFKKVIHDMPVHALDEGAVLDHMRRLVNIAREPQADEHVYISMHGFITVLDPGLNPAGVGSINAGCGVTVAKPVPTTTAQVAS